MRSYANSLALLERARKVTPGGAQTLSKRAAGYPEGAYPVFLEAAQGSHVLDVDGNWYIDWVCGLAAITLGNPNLEKTQEYPANRVWNAVRESARLVNWPSFSLPHRLEVDVAERLCQIIPCAEMVRFIKTGSESTEAAIRVARSYTGRDVILTVKGGYHSWHSWFAATREVRPGVPDMYRRGVSTFDYNDLHGLVQQFETVASWGKTSTEQGVAAVIMEPCLITPPKPGFLQSVKDLCRQYGALFILDEMITGFRWARAGGQEYFNVTPDLACYGKGCANGYPLAFLCGKREIMEHATVVSGTFGGETLSLAACQATLDVYEREPVIAHLWRIGDLFKRGLESQIALLGIPAKMEGYAVHPKLTFSHFDGLINRKLMTLWLQEMAEGGVLVHPSGWNVSYAHTEEDVQRSLDASRTAFMLCDRALKRDDWSGLRGKMIEENPFRKIS